MKYLVFLFLFICTGCLPIPHTNYHTPTIHGILQDGNKPLGFTNIYLTTVYSDGNCNKYELSTKTDKEGRFEIGPIGEFRLYAFLLGDPLVYWELCADLMNERKQIFNQTGIGYINKNLSIVCDTSLPSNLYDENTPRMKGMCELKDL